MYNNKTTKLYPTRWGEFFVVAKEKKNEEEKNIEKFNRKSMVEKKEEIKKRDLSNGKKENCISVLFASCAPPIFVACLIFIGDFNTFQAMAFSENDCLFYIYV